MELREITETSEDLPVLEAINEEAIPEIERCSLSDMLATGAKVWCIDDHQEPSDETPCRVIHEYVRVLICQREQTEETHGGTYDYHHGAQKQRLPPVVGDLAISPAVHEG